jgi:hypothetical protein
MDRIPTHQPNKRGIPVGVSDSTAVCRIHGSEVNYSENQTSTHQRPRTARRQRRQRRIGQSSLTSRLFASGLQSPTNFRYADRNQLQSLHRHATGDGCQRQSATGLATLREGLTWIPRRREKWSQHRSVHTLHVYGRRSPLGIGRTPSPRRL